MTTTTKPESAWRWVWFCVVMIAGFVGITSLLNWITGQHRPLWMVVVSVFTGLSGILALRFAEQRGWIKGVLSNRKEVERREKELAADRERIIADAKAKARE